jgi:hypothetical protein
MKNRKHTIFVGTVLKSNGNIVERGKYDTPISLIRFGTGTLIKSGGVKLVLEIQLI